MNKTDEETLRRWEEQLRKIEETANVGERLLAEGKTIVYLIPGLEYGEMIEEHPDGTKFLIRSENGKRVSKKPYYDQSFA